MNINTVHAAMMKTAAGYDREGNYISAERDKTDVRRGQIIPGTAPAEKAKRLQQINEASLQNPYNTANRSIPVDTTPDAPWAKGYENATGIHEKINSPYNSAMGQKYGEIYHGGQEGTSDNPTLKNWAAKYDWEREQEKQKQLRAVQQKDWDKTIPNPNITPSTFAQNMEHVRNARTPFVRDYYLMKNNMLPKHFWDQWSIPQVQFNDYIEESLQAKDPQARDTALRKARLLPPL